MKKVLRGVRTIKTSKKTAAKTEEGLTLAQERFCQNYTSHDREMFGNGTQSYIDAFDVDLTKKGAYDVARIYACKELTKCNIINRINFLLETGGFNDQNVDKQHLFLLNQHADLRTKLGAIKEYNELKKRINKRLDITSGGKPIPLFDNVTVSVLPDNNSNEKDTGSKE